MKRILVLAAIALAGFILRPPLAAAAPPGHTVRVGVRAEMVDVPRLALLRLRSSRVFVAERRLDSTTLRRAIDPSVNLSPDLVSGRACSSESEQFTGAALERIAAHDTVSKDASIHIKP